MKAENSQEIQDQTKTDEAIVISNASKDCRVRMSCDFEQNQTSETCFDLPSKFTHEHSGRIEGSKQQRDHIDDKLRALYLQMSQIGWKGLKKFIIEGDFLNNLRILDLSQNQLQDQGVSILFMEKKNTGGSLESLNLVENLIEETGAKVLSIYLTAPSLKKLDLSRNSIGNEGVKSIAEGSSWIDLEVQILNSIEIDSLGVEFLVSNESWKNLQELYLQVNPGMSDQSAVWLSCNHIPWRKLRKLMLDNSGIGGLGVLRHSRACQEVSVSNPKSKSGGTRTNWRFKGLNKKFGSNNYNSSHFLRDKIHLRGGKKEANSVEKADYQASLRLLDKINQYKAKILNNKSSDKELNLYVEMLAKHSFDSESDPFELTFGVQKYLLSPESKLRVVLLTGEAGAGKLCFASISKDG